MPFSSHSYSLHLIFSPNGWQQAQPMIEPNDRVLFLQDAVYLLQSDLNSPSPLLYARALDINARHINLSAQADKGVDIEAIEDELWIQLTEHAKNIISW
ncbi:DsrH/TusB family sulfur metabolism protein [Psychrosphaera aestuarii]|uniref:DsrH/TusB family sulfur metabolism protein n=1 Tax=Psychrosphaera aestuarii TaxID=1266052 RepID=UPI001B3399E0|nr:DsrH/TusB family sulfur metabolism protein [Psychrosphaera aestuarii]